jgi:two-component system chemotaxis response regulator CheY
LARILICDDSAFMRRMLKSILSKMEHEIVDEASNGIEAVEKYRQHKPDLTTMDITMPERDGIEAVRIICGKDKKAKIVMVTAIGQQPILHEAIAAGALDFIVKPFEAEQVNKTVSNILTKK